MQIMAKKLFSLLLAAMMLLTVLFVASASAASVMRGDVDGDGSLTPGDARLALRGSVGLEELTADFLMRADANADGKVEPADARIILRASVGLEEIPQSACAHQVEKWESVTLYDGSYAPYHKGVCTICGETLFADHDFELEITEPFTCTTPGKAIEKCACGVTGESVVMPADHTWEEVEGTKKEATCTEDGFVEMKCALCGRTKTETLPAGHVPGTEPTCTTPQKCVRCGQEIAPALGHTYKDGASVTVTQGIRCDRCGKTAVPAFNDLVNELKQGTHTYSGFTITVNKASKPVPTGMIEVMFNLMPKKDREQMMEEFTADDVSYTAFTRNRLLTETNYNLLGDSAVSRLTDRDVASITTERINGVDFLADLPDVYVNSRGNLEDLTAIKNTVLGDVIKVTVVLPTETAPEDSAIAKIDSDLGAIIEESSGEIGSLAGDMDIFGENGMVLNVNSVADLTVTYYFDAANNAPIAAHYDDGVLIDSRMDLYLNDDGSRSDKSTGSLSLNVSTKMDSYFFFDDYFNG